MGLTTFKSSARLYLENKFLDIGLVLCLYNSYNCTRLVPSVSYSNRPRPLPKSKPVIEHGLNKYERKNLKKRLASVHETLVTRNHIYKKLDISNKWDLASLLKKNELFCQDGVIALNKPYGVSRFKSGDYESQTSPSTIKETLSSSGNIIKFLSIEETLPLLGDIYKQKNLEVLSCPERWSSGVLLLGTSERVNNRVRKCFRISLANQRPHKNYLVATSGLTEPQTTSDRVSISLQYVPGFNKVPVIKQNFSKNEMQRKEVKVNYVKHRVLDYQEDVDAALVEIKVFRIPHHFLRVWMAHCYSPILGDLLYSGRISKVLGKRVKINPQQIMGYRPPDLSTSLLKKVDLSPSQLEMIPCHSHLSELMIESFHKMDLVIKAPLPEYFIWTCERLGLKYMSEETSLAPASHETCY